jgi:hypothetical protein
MLDFINFFFVYEANFSAVKWKGEEPKDTADTSLQTNNNNPSNNNKCCSPPPQSRSHQKEKALAGDLETKV